MSDDYEDSGDEERAFLQILELDTKAEDVLYRNPVCVEAEFLDRSTNRTCIMYCKVQGLVRAIAYMEKLRDKLMTKVEH